MLYIVATPIGNLDDITLRALNVLRECDIVVAEDPTITKKILFKYDISKPLWRYHEQSRESELRKIITAAAHQKIVFVTSAGTPGISDPAGKLVEKAREENIEVVGIPGASALTHFVSIAGRDFNHFHFVGFLPHKKGRQTIIKNLAEDKNGWPIIFYERGTRIPKLIEELTMFYKSGEIIIAKELTKIHESIYYYNLHDKIEFNEKGEFVVGFMPIDKRNEGTNIKI